ncbi:alpha/beta-hydrolase [Calocera viscosa TUFC12733]|uniref:Alpha/beta-hydrolase n=1 Tax=Calocera viscosa (strain TUFC12733) TaxID=1330018 RepID=A0A167NVV2_CALVF|nr:alpha/beta-hydrolase [Calocera viscosa TUFC12733]
MDPSDPTSFNHRTEVLPTGRTYHFVDQLPARYNHGDTPVLLLLHGFPDLWYGWRHQIGPWCQHGWRVIAVDMLGYGGTFKPDHAQEYSSGNICKDLSSLLDILGIRRVVVLGHDWGAYTAWKFCQWQTNRVRAVITLSVPLTPRTPVYFSLRTLTQKVPDFNYMLFFSDPASPSKLEKNVGKTVDLLFRTNKTWIRGLTRNNGMEKAILYDDTGRGDILNDKELAYYSQNFAKGGFRGPSNWYRALEWTWKEETDANLKQDLPASLPALFFQPANDPTCPQAAVDAMIPLVPNLQIVKLKGAGHWLMLECSHVVTQTTIKWLDEQLKVTAKL